jgi:succinoglycan biosynthesis transport protein ExoP
MSETEELGEAGAPDLRDYGRTIWRYRGRILLIGLIFALLAGVYSVIATPVYKATAQLIVQPSGVNGSVDAQTAARTVETEMAVLRSEPVQQAAAKKLGHTPTVTISNNGSSDVVDVSATSDTGKQAATDANAYASTYVALRRQQTLADLSQTGQQLAAKINQINSTLAGLAPGSPALATAQQQLVALQQQLDQIQVSESVSQVGPASVLATATVPQDPIAPKPVRNVLIALVLGLLIGVGMAFMRRYLGDTIVTREDLQWATDGLPVLGEIPHVRGRRDRDAEHSFVVKTAPTSAEAEGYRTLRTSIESLVLDRHLKYIQVTSAQHDDGKAFMLANLALTLARSGVEVTIVCCDLRQPLVHEVLGVSNQIGFTSILLGNATVQDVLQRVKDEPNLAIISAGPPVPSPSELLTSGRVFDVISRIKPRSSTPNAPNLILVDSAPVLPVVDSLIVSRAVDATLMVACANSSSRRALQRSVQMLRQNNAPLIGVVLNDAE